jgi:hypothetical protein
MSMGLRNPFSTLLRAVSGSRGSTGEGGAVGNDKVARVSESSPYDAPASRREPVVEKRGRTSMRAMPTDLVSVSGIVIDEVTEFGVCSRIREKAVFIPLFLIGSPRPAMEPGDVVTLSIPRWFARKNRLIG